ncbi:MAG: MiaB/RimO family radical SAM methylthiotransferase [Kiritimatiellia bacterium]
MKYHLVTLGCQMNKSDSERIAAVVEQMGYALSESEEDADLIGIVACSVRQAAIDRVYSKIHKWNQLKNSKSLLTFVTGCILPADREKFLKLFDLCFQISELPQLPAMIRQYGVPSPFSSLGGFDPEADAAHLADEGFEQLEVSGHKTIAGRPVMMKQPETRIAGFWDITPQYQSRSEAFIPIQNGCDKFCTFCAVPYTRGREISRPSADILAEVRRLVEHGYRSITLLGQNVNSYGRDKPGQEMRFAELLEEIGKYGERCGERFWLYFTSPHPRDMQDDVLEVIAKYACLAKQIHLPVQSGDNKLLIRMNRNHSVDDYRRIVTSIRRRLPTATLFTDIIVGFSGETDAQFANTVKLMQEVEFDMAFIARYSPRPGAASSRWDDDVRPDVKRARLHQLSEILRKHSEAHNAQMLGGSYPVLVTGKDRKEGYFSGLTEGKINIRFAAEDESLIGGIVDVEITRTMAFALEGRLCSTG